MIKVSLRDGTKIPALGFGTYRLEGKICTKAVTEALRLGYRHIDTAQAYDNQQAIAPCLKPYPREALYLVSKLWLGDHTRQRVPRAADKILRELDADYLDLLLIHWPDRTVPIGETLEAMAKLVEQGKVKSLGVSNFTIRHLQDALATGVVFVLNQVECHPYFYQEALFDFSAEHGIATTAYAPLHKGKAALDPLLTEIGRRYGKTPSQAALRWLIQKGLVAIPKTAHQTRMAENFDIFDFELSSEEVGEIDRLNTHSRTICPTFNDFDY